MIWLRRNAAAIAIVVIGVLSVVAISYTLQQSANRAQDERAERQRLSAIAGCERGNAVRSQVNENGMILKASILEAAQSRRDLAKISKTDQAAQLRKSARFYSRAAKRIEVIPLADCQAVYPQ